MDNLPLAGIRVLSLTTGAAGPMVAHCLGFFGAEVVHVETRVRPDDHRGGLNRERWNKSPTFFKLHRNQKSVTINMSTAAGVEVAKRLVLVSDVVVENFTLRVLRNWGMDYPSLRPMRPDLVMISLRGFGSTGPYANYATWGPNLGPFLGMTYLWNTPEADTPTAEARAQHPDFMSGICGAFAVMTALLHRVRTGQGQWIDAAQVEAGAVPLGPQYLDSTVNGRVPRPQGNRRSWAAPQGAYRCQGDDQWCVISVETEEQWQDLCHALDNPPWSSESRFATMEERAAHHDELDQHLEQWTRQYPKYRVMEVLQGRNVPAAAIQDVEDLLHNDAHLRDRRFFMQMVEPELGPVATEGMPVRLRQTPGAFRSPAPLLGQHTTDVCGDLLGIDEREVRRLEEERVLY